MFGNCGCYCASVGKLQKTETDCEKIYSKSESQEGHRNILSGSIIEQERRLRASRDLLGVLSLDSQYKSRDKKSNSITW